ncbi:MAG TPA: AsmA family protein [Burkholderiales bacterium]|nr:AsmA family protein [Burkholderiales bacterium]
MKKFLKIAAWSVVVIVIVAGAAVAYIAATFDPNRYKPQIVQTVKDKTGRTLKLDGDIKLSFFPRLGASLGRASLSEHDSDREFASFDDLHVAVALLPLLSKQVVVDGVEVTNLRAHLTRFRDGRTSIDDLTAPGPAAQSAPPAKAAAQPVAIDIDHIAVRNADVSYDDEGAGTRYELSKFNLETGRVAPGVPARIELSGHLQSDAPRLDLETSLETTLTFDLEKQRYKLDGLDLRAGGLAAGIHDLAAAAQGDVDARLANKEFVVSRLVVTATGKQEGGDLDVKLNVPQLTITEQQVSGQNIALDAKLSADQARLAVNLSVPAIAGNKQAFRADALNADLQMTREGMTVQGKLAAAVAGNLDAQRFELPKFQTTLHVEDPQLPKNPIDATVSGAAQADIGNQTASVTFATRFDDSAINGKAGLTRFTPPYYTFDIDIDKLDADRYLPKAAPTAAAAPTGATPAAAGGEPPLDLSALKTLNASGSLKIGALKIKNVKSSSVHVVVKAANGRLDVNPLTANLYQGALSGALSVNATAAPAIAVKQTLTGINIGPLLKDAANFDTLEGKGNVSLDVAGQGATVSAIRKALNGSASIKLSNGAIKGINIAARIRDVKSKLAELKGEQQTQPASATEETDFSELSASFGIKNGVAHNSDLNGKSPLLRLGGEGDIDIGNETLDYLLKATVVATAAGQGGKELVDLKGVTVPVRLSGPFSAPQYKIDFGGILEGLAKGKVEEKKQELQNKVQEKLQDKLKGLFNR